METDLDPRFTIAESSLGPLEESRKSLKKNLQAQRTHREYGLVIVKSAPHVMSPFLSALASGSVICGPIDLPNGIENRGDRDPLSRLVLRISFDILEVHVDLD